jgi:hypothetical protein
MEGTITLSQSKKKEFKEICQRLLNGFIWLRIGVQGASW